MTSVRKVSVGKGLPFKTANSGDLVQRRLFTALPQPQRMNLLGQVLEEVGSKNS